ncbi:MAG: hypothetical protein KGH75_03800 [Rhodospirillales bacterium]|nr:hypothetical protein [Rhodospirillales bacterium]
MEAYDINSGTMKFQTAVDRSAWAYNFIEYSPDNSFLAVASSSGEAGTVTILKASDGSVVGVLPTENATITNLQWIDNNFILASYDSIDPDGSVARIWNIRSLTLAGEYAGKNMQLVSLSPDSALLAAAIGTDVVVGRLK